ncbi:MAG: DMT family transporter [Colwellia sp.]|nr:DMT family transporter [Colwellia sp.]
MKPIYLIELISLAAIWGSSFIFMRIGSPEFGPFLFMALRTFTASLFLLPILYIAKQQKALNGYKLKMLVAGQLNTAIPFVLFGYATLTLAAGTTSVLNATTPMFGAIVAFLWLKQKLSLSATLGLFIGFIGVYFLVFDKVSLGESNIIGPAVAALVASLCYGFSANYTKRYLSGINSVALAAGSQISASLTLIPISLFFLPTRLPSNEAFISVILLGVVCTGIAYIIFFRLIANLGPAKAMSVTYLIPAFGLLWGSLFLDESISQWMIIGCSLILTGVALTTGLLKLGKQPNDLQSKA